MDKKPYSDIINTEYKKSARYKHMPRKDRAAQFAPFAAVSGYDDDVVEAARLTEERIELDEYEKARLDEKLSQIMKESGSCKKVFVTYFVSDSKKSGGEYVNKVGSIKKIQEFPPLVILDKDIEIPVCDIIDIGFID